MVNLRDMTEQPWLVGLADEIEPELPKQERIKFLEAFRKAGWDIDQMKGALSSAYVDLLNTRSVRMTNGIAESAYHAAGNTPVENYFTPEPEGMKFWKNLRPRG